MVAWHELAGTSGWPDGWIDGVRAAAGAPITLNEEAIVSLRYDALVWKDPAVRPVPPGEEGEPPSGLAALRGPGQLALADGAAGGILPICLAAGERLLLRSGALVLATAALRRLERQEPPPPRETGLEAFEATGEALVLLSAVGGCFGATLDQDERIDVAPGALLFAGTDLALSLVEQRLSAKASLTLVRCEGPGRLGIQTVIAGN